VEVRALGTRPEELDCWERNDSSRARIADQARPKTYLQKYGPVNLESTLALLPDL